MTYSEKLKDPRWQRRRLETMKQADFACEVCADSTEELHVHHKQYLNGYEPWEYDDSTLLCLCRTCHNIMHLDQEKVRSHCNRLAIKTEEKFRYVEYFERIVPSLRGWAKFAELDEQASRELWALRMEVVGVVKDYRKRADGIFDEWYKRNPKKRRFLDAGATIAKNEGATA